jgi:hypothetical protein
MLHFHGCTRARRITVKKVSIVLLSHSAESLPDRFLVTTGQNNNVNIFW